MVVREAQKAMEVTAVEPGSKVKRMKVEEAAVPEGSLADTPCQW